MGGRRKTNCRQIFHNTGAATMKNILMVQFPVHKKIEENVFHILIFFASLKTRSHKIPNSCDS
jgi:hypothetical protein